MKFVETTLPGNYSRDLYEDNNLDIAAEHVDKIFDVAVTAVADILSHTKSMNHPTAFVFNDLGKNFVAAAIVQYFESSDKDTPGNWSLVWTFEEGDIPANAVTISLDDPSSHTSFRGIAASKYGITFKDTGCLTTCIISTMVQLKKWLDENAKEGAEVIIEQDSLFQARVSVENGQKVFAMEVDGEIKNLIKDDAAIEK